MKIVRMLTLIDIELLNLNNLMIFLWKLKNAILSKRSITWWNKSKLT